MTLPRTLTRFACSDNTTLHVRTTATPDEIQTKISQDMGLSPPLMNGRTVSRLTGIDAVQGGMKPARQLKHDCQVPKVLLSSPPLNFHTPIFIGF